MLTTYFSPRLTSYLDLIRKSKTPVASEQESGSINYIFHDENSITYNVINIYSRDGVTFDPQCWDIGPLAQKNSGDKRNYGDGFNMEYLNHARLVDKNHFESMLKKHPFPIAFQLAIQYAFSHHKPAHPRSRKYGIGISNFVEDLIYYSLIPDKNDPFTYTFGEVDKVGELGKLSDNRAGRELFYQYPEGLNDNARIPQSEHGLTIYGMQGFLNVDYFHKMKLIDRADYEQGRVIYGAALGFQYALRKKLGVIIEKVEPLENMDMNLFSED